MSGIYTSMFAVPKWRKTERILDCDLSVYSVWLCVCVITLLEKGMTHPHEK